MKMPTVWFMVPEVSKPSGGTNHIYRLCKIAEELGIRARVLCPKPYELCDPPNLITYWELAKDFFNGVQEGDIVVSPEIWPSKPSFGVPIRRVVYVQNWAIAHRRMPWERMFLYYGGTHLNYAQARCGIHMIEPDYYLDNNQMKISHTINVINNQNRTDRFKVQPY